MKDSSIFPCCYFQTTVLCLDDNKEFLSNLILLLNEPPIYKLITKPAESISLLKNHRNLFDQFMTNFHMKQLAEDELIQESYFNLSNIHQVVYEKDRFNEPSIIIVDYDMPDMNGVELCRQLKNYPIKKIMLTGVADFPIAVQAFNEGIIDKFIVKSSKSMIEELNTAIYDLQWIYFQELTAKIFNSLPFSVISCLSDSQIVEFINNYFHKADGVEIYLYDSAGSFMMVDYKGNISWLTIATDKIISNYLEIAKDHEASEKIINDLKFRRRIPFFLTETDRKLPVSEWENFLYPANRIPGREEIYYTIIPEKYNQNFTRQPIFSYRAFLNKITSLSSCSS